MDREEEMDPKEDRITVQEVREGMCFFRRMVNCII
jgi:hypothetical protein